MSRHGYRSREAGNKGSRMGTTGAIRVKDFELPERYEALRWIADGGMASVWCAADHRLGRRVAIKVMSQLYADHEGAVRQFKREARAAARLSGHPHVVAIYDVRGTS